MRVRVWVLASLSAGLVAELGFVYAQQDNGSYTTELPPVEVAPPETRATRPAARHARTAARPTAAPRRAAVSRLRVYPTSPGATPSTALAVDKVPSSINFVNTPEIQRTNSLNVMDA